MTAVKHAKIRAEQRYGVHMNRKKYYDLIKKIKTGKSTLIEKKTNTRSVHLVDDMIVIYSKTQEKILTFLPKNCKEIEEYYG